MFGNDRDRMRQFYVDVWHKAGAGTPLDPMERIVAEVIADHPEYHPLLGTGDETALNRDYTPDEGQTNPFLHMGMHIALREQEGADRPTGIRDLIQRLIAAVGDRHAAEHQLMEPLGETLWEAQRAGKEPDQAAFLERVRKLVTDTAGGGAAH
ncbi:MAG: DUF1841 family protein, partial [Halofilum sp. (in: g-proteobacteria)]